MLFVYFQYLFIITSLLSWDSYSPLFNSKVYIFLDFAVMLQIFVQLLCPSKFYI